jgi:L-ribulokinase
VTTKYTIGLDYGTNSVRALVVDTADGREVGTAVWNYEHGTAGVMLSRDPNLARQHPDDYLKGAEVTIKKALADAKKNVRGFSTDQVVGIGVDTTGSTPLPVDANGQPLAFNKKLANNPAAMAWLWKDHTGVNEAAKITALAKKMRPQFLAKCGGVYSSEWFWSKILKCLRVAPEVFNAAHSWIELADYVPAALTGTESPEKFIGRCLRRRSQGDVQREDWGGYPDVKFLSQLESETRRASRTTLHAAFTPLDLRSADSRVSGQRKLV